MEHIERQSRLLRANLYIGHLNGRLDFAPTPEEGTFSKPFVHPDLIEDLEKLRNYERRGIRPMTRFIIELNILAWIAFAVLESTSFTSEMLTLDGPTTAKWITTAVFALVFLWRFLVHNWQD